MFLFLLLVATLATDPPTVPTPYPTITPAPKSDCTKIQDADKGPFPLDCLQSEFIRLGCSVRGHAYPDETRELSSAFNKQTYNDLTWAEVITQFTAYNTGKAGDTKDECLGTDTLDPTPDPTAAPTTLIPTPAPVVRSVEDSETPAPVFAADTEFQELIPGNNLIAADATGIGATLKAACAKKGYQREYDDSEYVIQILTDDGKLSDFYTTASDADASNGNTGGICELLGDFTAADFYWSDRHDGPFQKVTIGADGAWSIGTIKSNEGGDNRVFPRWYSDAAGGFGSPNTVSLDGQTGLAFEVKIASKRLYQPCRERVVPQATADLVTGADQNGFQTRCARKGKDGQDFTSEAVECENKGDPADPGHWDLRYAIANNQFATCDSNCIWSLDYSEADEDSMFWDWLENSDKQCWRKRSELTVNTWNECDTDPGTGTFTKQEDWAHVRRERQRLCKARCDYANGWILADDTCYHVADASTYSVAQTDRITGGQIFNPDSFTTNPEKGVGLCNAKLGAGYGTATQASVNSKRQNEVAQRICGDDTQCYFCGLSNRGSAAAECEYNSGTQVTYTNFKESEIKALRAFGCEEGKESEALCPGANLVLDGKTQWTFLDAATGINVLCAAPAQTDDSDSGRADALTCQGQLSGDGNDDAAKNEKSNTKSFPQLIVANSGFRDASKPGHLRLEVTVPKTMFNVYISFENSTNDAADYNWQWGAYPNDVDAIAEDVKYWSQTAVAAACTDDNVYQANIPWTVFNLGGAGGVQRLDTYELEGGDSVDTEDGLDGSVDDGGETYYQFGSVIRLEAKQPIRSSVTTDENSDTARVTRVTDFERSITVRMPFILRFQKTITVHTDVNIVSTKFNYKTVAAIIQSVQHSTQFFNPPYAKVNVQIRTKSQYPYMFQHNANSGTTQNNGEITDSTDEGAATVTLHRGDVTDTNSGPDNTLVDLELQWLADDTNCTFTNPDHMREGDICVQEWMLLITPKDTVCYATGEYSLEFKADCFHGKDVCYLPKTTDGEDIRTVTFTFKIQTSKFCPVVADEVDLTGTLTVTGRNSFKPLEECDTYTAPGPGVNCVEDDTAGSFYMQGETIFLLAETESKKATISSTKVTMVELVQDLSGLVQTGYNRVPYDQNTEDVTIWTAAPTDGSLRVADGNIVVFDGVDSRSPIELVKDEEVFDSDAFDTSNTIVAAGKTEYTFKSTEAGFKVHLHARAFPVNVDSYGDKTLVATLAVEYTDLVTGGGRRRLLTASTTDTRSKTRFKMNAFKPRSLPAGLGETASLSITMTLDSRINRANAHLFAHSMKDAIKTALNEHDNFKVYDSQVSIDAVKADGKPIWMRTVKAGMDLRRLEGSTAQTLTTEVTFAHVDLPNAMPLKRMVEVFDKQIKSPSSPLMHQPVFYGAIVHDVSEIKTSSYVPPVRESALLESSAFALIPCALFALLSALL